MVKVLLVDPALAALADRFAARMPDDVTVAAVTSFSEAEFRDAAADATIFIDARRPIGATELAMAPALRFVQMIGAGTDPLDLAALSEAGVVAAYNPGVNRTGAAEQTIMLMLALIKRQSQSERQTRAGQFAPGEIIAAGIDDLADATVGIVGMGHIGQAVAQRLFPFGSRLIYHARHPVPEIEASCGAVRMPLDELLIRSNIVTLHIPLTRRRITSSGRRRWQRCPRDRGWSTPGAVAWSMRSALRDAVASGHLAGAALDVLEHETDGTNPFADVPEVIVTPHLGGASRNSMNATIERCGANITRFLAGEPVHDEVGGAMNAESTLEFAEQASVGAMGPNAKASLEQLEARYDELLAALAWFIDAGRTDEALRLANALYRFWITKQRFAEGAVWFDRVLASPGGDALLRCKAVLNAGFMPFWMGDDERAAELFGQALEMARSLGDAPLTSQALGGLARVALRTDVAEGRRLAGEALAVSDAAGDEQGRSNALHLLGVGAQIAGDLIEAREWMTQRLALVRASGNEFLIGSEACNLSMVERQLGDLDAAEALAREALEIERGRAPSSRPRSRSAVWRPSPRSAASSTAPRRWSVPPRRSWMPRGWPGRQTNDPTTSICWRPCPRRWDRKGSRRPASVVGR